MTACAGIFPALPDGNSLSLSLFLFLFLFLFLSFSSLSLLEMIRLLGDDIERKSRVENRLADLVFRLYMTKNIYFTLVVLCELRCKRLFAVVSVKTQVTVALILCTVPSHGIASACARELLLTYFRAWARAKLSGAES